MKPHIPQHNEKLVYEWKIQFCRHYDMDWISCLRWSYCYAFSEQLPISALILEKKQQQINVVTCT